MLTLPATFGLYLERAWPRHRRLAATARRPGLGRGGRPCWNGSPTAPSGCRRCSPTRSRVSAHLVLTAERVVAAEAARTLGSLALMGVRVAELLVNQILVQDDSFEYRNLPAHPAFDWYSERIAEQRAVLDELDTAIGDVKLVLVPHLAGEPIGPKALGELLDAARLRDGSPPPGPLRPVVDRESGTGLDAVYRMRLELPQVDPGALTLGRVDDDLIIGSGGMRRRVRLASVLRRCIVIGAQFRGGELTVRFRPNPEVWPSVTGEHPDIPPELRQLAQAILDKLDPAVRMAAARRSRRRRRTRSVPAGVVPGVRARGAGDRRTASAAVGDRRAQRGAADGDRARWSVTSRPRHRRHRHRADGDRAAERAGSRYEQIPVTLDD